MEIVNSFKVPVGIDQAFELLTDLERIAPCLPGATLTGVEGEEYHGKVRVKVGPITVTYQGVARFVSKDPATRTAVLKAEGREVRGQGNASALVTAELVESGEGTQVTVRVDLTIAGRVAQFGRGVLGEVSEKLMAQFAANLEEMLEEGEREPADSATSEVGGPSTNSVSAATSATKEEEEGGRDLNGLALLAKPVAKRVAPLVALGIVVVILVRRRGRR
jgi:carbon monoxide dehydrogenase subunit G